MIQTGLFWGVLLAAVSVHWLLPRALRPAFLALSSAGYLATLAPGVVAGLALWITAFYLLIHAPRAEGPDRDGPGPDGAGRRSFHAALIVAILGQLAWFKYLPPLAAALGLEGLAARTLVPLGMSFFTFKLVHYAVEVARGNVRDRNYWQFAAYMFLFPIFTAGPIERYDHYRAHQADRLALDDVVFGLTRIVHGLVKKLVLAEMVVRPLMKGNTGAEIIAGLDALPSWKIGGWMALLFLHLYLDFSAYSDIGIGASRLFGLRIGENFNFPFVARNINEFWKRWHMSLSGWCQAYVYLPTIGLTRNPYLAVTSTFVVMGLWHAGSLTRILWGLYHAGGIIAFTQWSKWKRKRAKWLNKGYWPLLGQPITWAFLAGSACFLAVEDAGDGATAMDALRLLAKLIGIYDLL